MKRLCLVTGGSRGIGKGIVKTLCSKGYKVAYTYNENENLAEDLEKEIKNSGGIAKSFHMSLESRASIRKALEDIKDHFTEDILIIINNAAISQEKSFDKIIDDDWENMLRVNLQGPFICSQETLPDLIKNKWGRIINITSIGGQWGGVNQVHYAASKAALINLTQSLAKLYSHAGITVNAVSVGLTRTDMSTSELESEEGIIKVKNIPIGRVSTIDEISSVVRFLCSEDASYVTGQTINVNGGMYFG